MHLTPPHPGAGSRLTHRGHDRKKSKKNPNKGIYEFVVRKYSLRKSFSFTGPAGNEWQETLKMQTHQENPPEAASGVFLHHTRNLENIQLKGKKKKTLNIFQTCSSVQENSESSLDLLRDGKSGNIVEVNFPPNVFRTSAHISEKSDDVCSVQSFACILS